MRWLGLVLACLLPGSVAAGTPVVVERGSVGQDVLVLGRISDDPKAHFEQLKPLLDYVVPRLRDVGITSGRILMAHDPQQMSSYLRRGQVDWFTETTSTATFLQQRAGAQPLLWTERNGVSWYETLILVRRDSGIDSVAQLRSRRIAFQRTTSTSGYVVPAATLLDAGLPLEILLSPKDRPSPDAVGYLFAGSELNVVTWVHKRLADAGAISSVEWDDGRLPASFRADMRVLLRTAPFPRGLEMVRGNLDARVRQRLREVLLQAADDPAAAPALRSFFGTTRFLALDDAARRSLEHIAASGRRVRETLE
ncbi:MAG: phosphate/phosphite/phosphonate ABC transporter substrate-binding protein [Steroidobacteraceae bacterium]